VAISNSSGLLSFKVSSLLVMGVTYLVSGWLGTSSPSITPRITL
jgi:hypothetical protein